MIEEAMIDGENIYKQFGDQPVLRGASFSVAAGEVAALVGPNGAGKSTLLRVLAGLMAPDAGTARIGGADVVRRRQAAQARLAYFPQEVHFHEAMTPREVLRFYVRLRQVPAERVEPLLEEVALSKAADRPCGALSGGMRQRLGLAVTWLPEAPVVLLDEPGLSLDPDWRAYLREKLRAEAAAGRTVLMATHWPEAWRGVADRTLRVTDERVQPAGEEPPAAAPAEKHVTNCSPHQTDAL